MDEIREKNNRTGGWGGIKKKVLVKSDGEGYEVCKAETTNVKVILEKHDRIKE